MIYEYALEPEMVAAWGKKPHNRSFCIREFGLGSGRIVSRYPKKWVKKVWDSFDGASQIEKKRLEELLAHLKETMVKRKDPLWDNAQGSWLENALAEYARYPFFKIMARNNPAANSKVIDEETLAAGPCPGWDDVRYGMTVKRKAEDMAKAVDMMLGRCRWVKFIDPYFVKGKQGHKESLTAFLKVLAAERPVGPPETIEIHTSGDGDTTDRLKEFYENIIPADLKVTMYRWQEREGGQKLHNRYILTDLGGVSFPHGLDTGADGEIDDIIRLDREPYFLHCKQYDPNAPAFDQAESPLEIIGAYRENNQTMPKRVSPRRQK